MKWSHLPVAGGLYDQSPVLLEQWRYIFSERNKYQAEQDAKRDAESKAASRNKGGRSSPRRPSRPRR